ncbi:MAG: hypothetical protein J6U64_04365, partial [Alphaproteobacteria bacterium]|nr:hypothetical protein [Alphaproteobacteria bacterium]
LYATGSGSDSVGMTADSDTGTASTATNNGSITISQIGGGTDLTGMSATSDSQEVSSGIQNNGSITLSYQATTPDGGNQVVGLKSDANSLVGNGTSGSIQITNTGRGSTIGIKTDNDCTNLVNAGTITLTGTRTDTGENSRTVGIEAEVLGLNNSGIINITSASDTTLTGIWAKDNASTISNTADITVTHTGEDADIIRGIWTENTTGTLSNTADISLTTDSLAEIIGIKTSATNVSDNGKISITRNNMLVSSESVYGLYDDNTNGSITRTNGRIYINSGLTQAPFIVGIYAMGGDVRILDTEEETETDAEISVSANTSTSGNTTVAGIYTTNTYAGILNQTDMNISLLGTGTGYGIYSVGANASTGNAVTNSGQIELSRRYSGATANNLVGIWAENSNGVLSNSGKIDVSSNTTTTNTTPAYVSGIYFGGKQLTNRLHGITVSSFGTAFTSGIWHENTASNAVSLQNEAPISVTNNGTNETYGIYSKTNNPDAVFSLTNSGNITVNRTNTDPAVTDISGIKMDNKTGVLTNTGDINVSADSVNKNGTVIHYVTGIFSNGTTLVNGEEEDTDSDYEIIVAMNETGSATVAGIYNMENEIPDDTEDTDTEEASVLNYGDIHIITKSTDTTYGIYADVEQIKNNGKIFIESTDSSVIGIDGWRKAKTITNNGHLIVNNTGNGSVTGISGYHEKNQVFNTGNMDLTSDGTGWMYGVYTNGIHINNTADINITRNNDTESQNSAYGLWLDNKPPLATEGNITNSGNLTIFSNSTSQSGVGGIFNSYEGAVLNEETGKINITLNGSGNALVYGIHSPGEILNRATIDIDHNGGTGNVYGIDGYSLEITNEQTGHISIKANGTPNYYFGISNEEGSIANSATIRIIRTLLGSESASTSMYGIYGEEGVILSYDPQTLSSEADIYLYSNGLDAMYGIYGNAEPEGDSSLYNGASIGLIRENGLLEATNNMVGIWANNPLGIVLNDVLGSISLTATSMNSLATETDTTVMAGILSYALETTNKAAINVSLGSGDADIYGIYTDNESTESTLLNTGLAITLTTGGTGRAYGIFSGVAESTNEGAINIISSASADIFGISSEDLQSVINNNGAISLTQTGQDLEGTAYGIHSVNETSVINNGGKITINSSGIGILSGIDTDGAEVYNEGDIIVTRTSSASSSAVHGIRMGNPSGNVTNRANITLSSPANTGILAGIWSEGLETTHGQIDGNTVTISITQNDVSASDIYGIYAQNDNAGVTNNQIIDITSAGTASSHQGGIWIDGTNASAVNNGTININEKSTSFGEMFGIWSVGGGTIENAGPVTGVVERPAGQINLEGNGAGTLYGIKGTATDISNAGNITSQNYAGTGTLYGIYADGASTVLNDETGNISLTGTGTIYGTYLEGETTEMTNKGHISVNNTNLGGATIYGVYTNGATFTNKENAVVSVVNNTTGLAYGIYATAGGKVINEEKGAINVYNNGANGTAIGIYLDGSEFTNSGTLDIKNNGKGTIYGIYATGESTVTNNGLITLASTGTETGIYATEGAVVFNTGIIEIGGQKADLETDQTTGEVLTENPPYVVLNGQTITFATTTSASRAIVLENGAKLVNAGTLSAKETLDLDEFGKGSTILSKGGIVSAQRIKGTLVAGSSLVTEGNETVYTAENVLQSDDTSGLNLTSGSALFNATTDGSNVVMTMKDFS